MSDTLTVASKCGTCQQTDDHPKHQILVAVAETPNGKMYHPHDFDENGSIYYHFDCDSEWHDLFSKLATDPYPSPDSEQPWLAWEEPSAAEHRAVATMHAAIVAKAKSGTQGEALRAWIIETHAVAKAGPDSGVTMMAGGIDSGMANAVLDAQYPNSSTTTIGAKTVTGPTHARVMTANGSDTSNGTEASTSGGYTAGGTSAAFASASTQSKATSAPVSWTNMPGITSTGVEIWDTSGTPLRQSWGPWSGGNVTVGAGNTLTIATASLSAALA